MTERDFRNRDDQPAVPADPVQEIDLVAAEEQSVIRQAISREGLAPNQGAVEEVREVFDRPDPVEVAPPHRAKASGCVREGQHLSVIDVDDHWRCHVCVEMGAF
ncbi:hypothetical protein ACFQU7_31360 [Pseudoroseomonas wenyumeiae]